MRRRISAAEVSVGLLLATLIFALWNLTVQSRSVAQASVDQAFESAEVMSRFASTAQQRFTESLGGLGPYEVPYTVDVSSDADGIPFPATFSRTVTETFSAEFPDSQFRIYSDYPIGEAAVGRELDDFARDALDELRDAPNAEIRREIRFDDGTTQVRLATPVVMEQNCVSCHNSEPFAVEGRVWEVGDVRGIREVSLTIPTAPALNISSMPALYALVTFAGLLTLFFVLPSVRREVASRELLTEQAEQLQQEVAHDTVSGLRNRKFFDERFQELVARSHAEDLALTLLAFDVDQFKTINDTYGHLVGDQVIAEIGERVRREVRQEDVAARIGGDEFSVAAIGLSLSQQRNCAARIVEAIGGRDFSLEQGTLAVTVSAGCASLLPEEQAIGLCRRADRLLYEAKFAGRNRVMFGAELGAANAKSPTASAAAATS